jgi:hypothetical protein
MLLARGKGKVSRGTELCLIHGFLSWWQTPEELDDSDFETEDFDVRSRTSVQTEDDQLIAGQSARVRKCSLVLQILPIKPCCLLSQKNSQESKCHFSCLFLWQSDWNELKSWHLQSIVDSSKMSPQHGTGSAVHGPPQLCHEALVYDGTLGQKKPRILSV